MSSRSEAEISEAVREYVTECIEGRIPRDGISEFIRRLADERGWREADADQIARSAIDVLRVVAPHLGPDQDG